MFPNMESISATIAQGFRELLEVLGRIAVAVERIAAEGYRVDNSDPDETLEQYRERTRPIGKGW